MQLQEVAEDAFRREGIAAGFKKFVELAAVDYNDREPEVALPPPTSHRSANLSFFFTNDSPAVRRYRLDLAALHESATRIVPATGSAAESAPYTPPARLAPPLHATPLALPARPP